MLNYNTELDQLFQALADPTLRQLLERLSRGPATVSELAAPLPISLPAVVQQLKLLENSGIVKTEKVGRVRTCTLQAGALKPAEQWINERRTAWERRLDRLGDFLALPNDTSDPGSSS